MKTIRTIGVAIAMASLAACTNMTKEQQGTVTGGLMGAAAGAGLTSFHASSAPNSMLNSPWFCQR